MQMLVDERRKFDIIFLDADKQKYIEYYEMIVGCFACGLLVFGV